MPNAQRPANRKTIRLAFTVFRGCVFNLVKELWRLHPVRASLMAVLHIIHTIPPASRDYSQVMVVDEAVDAPVLLVFIPVELLASRSSESFSMLRKQPSTRLPGRTRASSKSQSNSMSSTNILLSGCVSIPLLYATL